MDTKRRSERENILCFAIIAMCATVGAMTLLMLVLGIDATACDLSDLVSLFTIGTGTIWGVLLWRNC